MNEVDVPSMKSGTSSDDSSPMESIELRSTSDVDDTASDGNQKVVEVTCSTTDLAKARRLRSSRASSLLDHQLEDDEGDEPDLEVTDDDDATSNSTMVDDCCEPQPEMRLRPTTPPRPRSTSTSRAATDFNKSNPTDADGAQSLVLSPADEKKGVDKLVCLTDGMITNYFCPTTVDSSDADAIRIQVQTNNTMRDARNRSESDLETDTRASSEGARWSTTALSPSRDNQDCYSSVLSQTNNGEQTSQNSDSTPKQRNTMCSDLVSLTEMRQHVAADVAALLGTSRGAWLMALRDWLLQPSCTRRYYASTSTGTSSTSYRRVVRNRISVRRTQTRRMQQLWLEWHAQSLDNMEDPANCNNNRSPRAAAFGPSLLWSLGMTRSLDDSHLNTRTKENMSEETSDENVPDTYYDSDPESFRRSRVLKSRAPLSKPHDDESSSSSYRLPSPINTAASFTGPSGLPTTPRNNRKKSLAAGVPRQAPSFGLSSSSTCTTTAEDHGGLSSTSFDANKFDLRNDTMVEEFLKEVTFRKIPLVLHPDAAATSENDEENKESDADSFAGTAVNNHNKRPIAVQGWFEMGSRLENRVIQPKFMWRKTYQPNLSTRRKLSCEKPDSIELLSMVRILKPSQLNRKHFPFAKVDHSFSILANSKEFYLFEAQSRQERDWIVHGLKLVVARLASMIIVGDEQMFVEFFSPWAHSPLLEDDAFLLTRGNKADENDEEKEEAVQDETTSNEEGSSTGSGADEAAKFVPGNGRHNNQASLWVATAATATACGRGGGDSS